LRSQFRTGHHALVIAGLDVPRFDSAGAVVLNVLGFSIFVVAVLLLALRQKSDHPPPYWAWALCFINVSYDRVYLPIGPLLVLLILGAGVLTGATCIAVAGYVTGALFGVVALRTCSAVGLLARQTTEYLLT
jgi:hypothetical protein